MSDRLDKIAGKIASDMTSDEALILNTNAVSEMEEWRKWWEEPERLFDGVLDALHEVEKVQRKIERSSPDFKKDAGKALQDVAKVRKDIHAMQTALGNSVRDWMALGSSLGAIE
jgi:uncharacterized protein (DUF3084 family)